MDYPLDNLFFHFSIHLQYARRNLLIFERIEVLSLQVGSVRVDHEIRILGIKKSVRVTSKQFYQVRALLSPTN